MRLKNKTKEFRHQYFKKGHRELLQFIKRKTSNESNPDAETASQKSLNSMMSAFKDLKVKHQQLKEEHSKNKFLMLEKALGSIKDAEIKQGVFRMIEVISQAAKDSQNETEQEDISGRSKKLSMIKKLFKSLNEPEESEEPARKPAEEERGSQISTTDEESEGSSNLGKRSFGEAGVENGCFEANAVDFMPMKKLPSLRIELQDHDSFFCQSYMDEFDYEKEEMIPSHPETLFGYH